MSEPPPAVRLGRQAFAWLLGWCFAAALYWLLIDITDLPELLVGAGAAVLAATAFELTREQQIVAESVRLRWLSHAYRPLLRVPSDIAIVTLVVLRALVRRQARVGSFRAVSFTCGDSGAREQGREALAELAGSLAPNTFVVGIDTDRELILAHQLHPLKGRETLDPLGLG